MSKNRTQQVKMTDEHAALVGAELVEMHRQAEAQLTEHRMYLRQLVDSNWLHEPMGAWIMDIKPLLLEECDNVKLGMVRKEANGSISIVYEYGDALYALLTNPNSPAVLRKAVAGGIELSDEPSTMIKRVD